MSIVRIHFTSGKPAEITTTDAAKIIGVLNVEPNGTTCINNSNGTALIINRINMTHVEILPS